MLAKDPARSGDPRRVIPHLCLGSVPSSVGRDNRFHLEFDKPLHDVPGAPDQSLFIVGFGEVVRLEELIEVVVGFGIIFRTHVGIEELLGCIAGFFFRIIGFVRYEDECVVLSFRIYLLI